MTQLQKRARVMLTALALFTMVGGALAFKAYRGQGNVYCQPQCNVNPVNFRTTTNQAATGIPCAGAQAYYISAGVCTPVPATLKFTTTVQ